MAVDSPRTPETIFNNNLKYVQFLHRSMSLLGQTGADTVTHIVSIVFLAALGLGVPAVVGVFQPAALGFADAVPLFSFETVVAIMAAYYSIRYQTTPTGGVSISTDATSVK